ncbi:Uncharacterized protein APZ42_002701 [Daphnia magna]|uniref:Uncharacterized protein n=1 Tax=Daphnia magna TaxID=35525 RepID=A0A164I3J5_9CRUS|nr:Uncharacterized protein APZ42_002701 [Daphnia magna]
MNCWRDTEPPELSSENTWVPMLVVVALVSAMLGAVLMITALKCRRNIFADALRTSQVFKMRNECWINLVCFFF